MKTLIEAIIVFFKSLFSKENIILENKKVKVNCNNNSNSTIHANINVNNGSDSSE